MARRLVIDSNMMRPQDLRDFLSEADSHIAVLPDVIWIEAYKSRTLESVADTLSIVGEHSDQIILLKSSGEIAMLDPALGMSDATMRDRRHELREVVEALALGRAGETAALEQFEMQWS